MNSLNAHKSTPNTQADMSQTIERTALTQLVTNEQYARKVLPFMKGDYFSDKTERTVFEEITKFVDKYNKIPTQTSLEIEVSGRKDLNEEEFKKVVAVIQTLESTDVDFDWLVNTTEQFCKDKAVYNAIVEGISIIDVKDKQRGPDAITNILTDALAVGFDNRVGHDYLVDADDRFDFYHTVEEKIPFDLEFFNRITKGGLPPKTLNIALAGTGVGKSLFMCHLAANYLMQNKNVLYITLEMAEERIAERIDANLMNLDVQSVQELPKSMFDNKIEQVRKETTGKLVVKEYPTASAHKGHFSSLLNELALKKSFKPDAIFIDYLNICASQRFKAGANINSYTLIKSIAEELRGLAVEYNLPIISATQTTRQGFNSTDIGLEDTSESFGLPATVDFMFALISTEELESQNQIMVKQLKNRYNDPTKFKRFLLGIDRSRMKVYDLEESAQADIINPPKAPTMVEVVETNAFDKLKEKRSETKYKDFSNFKV